MSSAMSYTSSASRSLRGDDYSAPASSVITRPEDLDDSPSQTPSNGSSRVGSSVDSILRAYEGEGEQQGFDDDQLYFSEEDEEHLRQSQNQSLHDEHDQQQQQQQQQRDLLNDLEIDSLLSSSQRSDLSSSHPQSLPLSQPSQPPQPNSSSGFKMAPLNLSSVINQPQTPPSKEDNNNLPQQPVDALMRELQYLRYEHESALQIQHQHQLQQLQNNGSINNTPSLDSSTSELARKIRQELDAASFLQGGRALPDDLVLLTSKAYILLPLIDDILQELSRKTELVEHLSAVASSVGGHGQPSVAHEEAALEQQQAMIRTLETKIHRLEGALESQRLVERDESQDMREKERRVSAEMERLEAESKSWERRYARLQSEMKKKEKDVADLRKALEVKLEKEEQRTQRDQEVFKAIFSRDPKEQMSAGDSRAMQVVRAYESHRRAYQQEIASLRKQIRALSEDLRERDNAELMSSGSEQEVCSSGRKLNTSQLSHREAALRAEIQELRGEVDRAGREAHRARERCRVLEDEARDREHEIGVMEERAAQLRRALEAAAADLERERAPREDHIPRASEILRSVCAVLQVDHTRIYSSVVKMVAAVAAIPNLEAFVRDVCDIVREVSNERIETPQQTLYELKRVGKRLDRANEMDDLRAGLVQIVSKRIAAAAAGSVSDQNSRVIGELKRPSHLAAAGVLPAASKKGKKVEDNKKQQLLQEQGMTDAMLLSHVMELVDHERRTHDVTEAFASANEAILSDPSSVTAKMIQHYMKLFEVRELKGVIVHMNSLYGQMNECANAFRVLRSIVGLDSRASLHQIMSNIRSAFEPEADSGS